MAKLSDLRPENKVHYEQEDPVIPCMLLQKMYDWQETYDHIPWSEFKDNYYKCHHCEGYDNEQCICYTR